MHKEYKCLTVKSEPTETVTGTADIKRPVAVDDSKIKVRAWGNARKLHSPESYLQSSCVPGTTFASIRRRPPRIAGTYTHRRTTQPSRHKQGNTSGQNSGPR